MSSSHAFVATARSWIGTRFHHQGRLKKSATHKGGVDCLGLLVGVAAELGLGRFAEADETDYSHQPDVVRLRQRLSKLLTPVDKAHIACGDIVLLNVDGNAQHLAIVSDFEGGLGIIHAYAPAKAVVEHRLDAQWMAKIVAVYSLPAN